MKIQSLIAAGFMVILSASFITANARQNDEAPIKVLPTTEKGILKILYAADAGAGVHIKFYDDDNLLFSEKVKGEKYHKGFSKKYDVRNLKPGIWVEVTSATMSVTYKLTASRNWQAFEPFLEKTIYNHELVAANN